MVYALPDPDEVRTEATLDDDERSLDALFDEYAEHSCCVCASHVITMNSYSLMGVSLLQSAPTV
jgi:hypothetical protein